MFLAFELFKITYFLIIYYLVFFLNEIPPV
jgi:hypothetical protein